jgi:hypothetical protein
LESDPLAGLPATARSVLSGPRPQRVEVEAGVFRLSDDAGILLRHLVLFPKFTLNFTMQKEDFSSHQNTGTYMEY